MDKQKRLTKTSEWKLGLKVQWLKGREFKDVFVCERVGTELFAGCVWLKNVASGTTILFYKSHWNKRFVVLPNAEAHGRAVARTVQPLVGSLDSEA